MHGGTDRRMDDCMVRKKMGYVIKITKPSLAEGLFLPSLPWLW